MRRSNSIICLGLSMMCLHGFAMGDPAAEQCPIHSLSNTPGFFASGLIYLDSDLEAELLAQIDNPAHRRNLCWYVTEHGYIQAETPRAAESDFYVYKFEQPWHLTERLHYEHWGDGNYRSREATIITYPVK